MNNRPVDNINLMVIKTTILLIQTENVISERNSLYFQKKQVGIRLWI